MKKTIIKISVFILTFLVSLVVISKVMNKGNNKMTMEMAPASLPTVTMEKDGIAYNQLHGYRKAMDVSFQRETVTELGPNRELTFMVDSYNAAVGGISIEVRSIDGERLIENSPVTDISRNGKKISASIALKDLIEADKEYMVVVLLEIEGETVRYYTRVVWSENTHAAEKLNFVKDFHGALYDRELAREKELTKYLEPSSQGDNTTFHKVNIHSSFNQVTWGELDVKEVAEPVILLRELAGQTASVLLNYVVTTSENKAATYYQVEEYYRIRYTPDRMYLLDYERTMTQIPDVGGQMYANDKILLGIVSQDLSFVESADGNIVVFEVANRLCSYNVTGNKLAVLFSFYDAGNGDARTMYQQHGIKILDVDEGGNVRFAVYGYMNRGRHEGEVGIQIYQYDSSLNTIEEAVYIPSDKSFEVLNRDMEQLLFLNRDSQLYLFLENTVYGINLVDKTYERIADITQDDSMRASEDHTVLVWQVGDDIYHSRQLMVKNLNTGAESTIRVEEGEAIRPLGFMGEDIIYGVAREADIAAESSGRVFFPMYKVCIRNSAGELMKEYQQENIYVMDVSIAENQITLEQMQRGQDGGYRETTPEHIMNNEQESSGRNKLVVASVDRYEKYVEIQVRSTIDNKTIKILTPKEVVFEGGRELELVPRQGADRYYVYGPYGVEGIYYEPARAVEQAYSISGVVVDERGHVVWLRGNRVTRNQIMAIQEESSSQERSSLAVCLDTILQFEGIVRNSQALLDQGQTVPQILEGAMEDAQILDLSGCSLDAVLYYVNQDIPVLAVLENGEAVLVTGFNEFNVVIMEPSSGTLYKKGLKDSAAWFEENGNCFITYINWRD